MGFGGKLLKMSLIAVACPALLIAAQQQNPRNNPKNVVRGRDAEASAMVRRSATSVIARSVAQNARQSRTVVTARPTGDSNIQARTTRSGIISPTRSRTASKPSVARSGVAAKSGSANKSRAGVARATAVFKDISKIGGGYNECRDSYATCMDQFCANANDTYRRCYCSDRFTGFRETSDKLDEALKLLADFQNNDLNAVDKTAAEVNAMYTATEGEKAIKQDASASQKLLDSIGDVLSGKSSTTKNTNSNSLGVLDLSVFGDDNDDIWGGESVSIFDNAGSSSDLTELEGKALYNKVNKQCAEITRQACGSDAMFNLAKSAYSIMIGQDCNAFEKTINTKKANIEETVRTAEKYLREARLEEYRSHNSADVNECLSKVETALRQPTACGENFEKCMDYTGLYVNSNTGEPIYSPALFGLNKLIVLNGSADVLSANSDFDKILDEKRIFATTALNSCRDLADTVWHEFKRSAIIQIAQAQDEMIQQVKDSCVTTIKECYDTQTGALNKLDTTESQVTGAIAAGTAKELCEDRVQTCAALYGDPNGCKYDDKTKKITNISDSKCGLNSLINFVKRVDEIKTSEGCETVLTKYAHELCDPKFGESDSVVYPLGCANMEKEKIEDDMHKRMDAYCPESVESSILMKNLVKEIYSEIKNISVAGCEDDKDVNGVWVDADIVNTDSIQLSKLNQKFYKKYYGTALAVLNQVPAEWAANGLCLYTTADKELCEAQKGIYNAVTNDCTLDEQWYIDRCDDLNGTWNGAECTVTYNDTSATVSTSDDSESDLGDDNDELAGITLPDGYTRLQYIQSDGYQFIDTGVATSGVGIKTKVKMEILNTDNAEYSIIGRMGAAGYDVYFKDGNIIGTYNDGGKSATANISYSPGTIYTITSEMSSDKITQNVNGKETAYIGTLNTPSAVNMSLFNHNYRYYIKAKMYYTKIWQNGSLVRTFVPAIRNSDNKVGLYDTDTSQFFINYYEAQNMPQAKPFIAGPVAQ